MFWDIQIDTWLFTGSDWAYLCTFVLSSESQARPRTILKLIIYFLWRPTLSSIHTYRHNSSVVAFLRTTDWRLSQEPHSYENGFQFALALLGGNKNSIKIDVLHFVLKVMEWVASLFWLIFFFFFRITGHCPRKHKREKTVIGFKIVFIVKKLYKLPIVSYYCWPFK